MTDKVDYEELLPHEFEARLAQHPVGYLPIGTLEWHGVHNALGADFLQSRGLFRRAARRFGGIVFPPLWLAPDRIAKAATGTDLVGMDYADSTRPPRQLPGNLYWIPKGLFLMILEAFLAQAQRAGFKCIVADGHGPSRIAFAEMANSWESQFGLHLVSAKRDFPGQWKTQMDHAGRNETSIMLAVAPELVDLSQLPVARDQWPQGVAGADPRDATATFGEALLESTLTLIGAKLHELSM